MKLTRYFVHTEHEDTGITGFVPLWIPKAANFDPSGAQGMLHDVFEHRLCDRGRFHEEVMAFGRLAATRAIPGFSNSGMYSPEEALGKELAGIWERWQQGNAYRKGFQSIERAPETAEVWCHTDECFLNELNQQFGIACVNSLEYFSDDEEVPKLSAEDQQSVLSWLRIGYLDAYRRYKSPYWIGELMTRWATDNTKRIARLDKDSLDGCILRLNIDTDRNKITDTLIEPDWEYGRMPKWARRRLWAWEHADA